MKALNGVVTGCPRQPTLKLTVKSWASVAWSKLADTTSSTAHQNNIFWLVVSMLLEGFLFQKLLLDTSYIFIQLSATEHTVAG
jgi:hypothetical protein